MREELQGLKIVLSFVVLCGVISIADAKPGHRHERGAYVPDEFSNITDLSDPVILECWQPFLKPRFCLQDLVDIYYKRVDWMHSPVGPKCCRALSTLPCKKPMLPSMDPVVNPLLDLYFACIYHGYHPKIHLRKLLPPFKNHHEWVKLWSFLQIAWLAIRSFFFFFFFGTIWCDSSSICVSVRACVRVCVCARVRKSNQIVDNL